MKTTFLYSLMVIGLIGCRTDHPDEGNAQFHYINKSAIYIELALIHGFDHDPAYKSHPIAPGDTGRFWKDLSPSENENFIFNMWGGVADTVSILFRVKTSWHNMKSCKFHNSNEKQVC